MNNNKKKHLCKLAIHLMTILFTQNLNRIHLSEASRLIDENIQTFIEAKHMKLVRTCAIDNVYSCTKEALSVFSIFVYKIHFSIYLMIYKPALNIIL